MVGPIPVILASADRDDECASFCEAPPHAHGPDRPSGNRRQRKPSRSSTANDVFSCRYSQWLWHCIQWSWNVCPMVMTRYALAATSSRRHGGHVFHNRLIFRKVPPTAARPSLICRRRKRVCVTEPEKNQRRAAPTSLKEIQDFLYPEDTDRVSNGHGVAPACGTSRANCSRGRTAVALSYWSRGWFRGSRWHASVRDLNTPPMTTLLYPLDTIARSRPSWPVVEIFQRNQLSPYPVNTILIKGPASHTWGAPISKIHRAPNPLQHKRLTSFGVLFAYYSARPGPWRSWRFGLNVVRQYLTEPGNC